MSYPRFRRLWLPVLLLLLSTPVWSADAGTDLSGTWQLNEDASEDPREKMSEVMDKRSGRGPGGTKEQGGGGGFGGGRSGGGGFGGGGPGSRGGVKDRGGDGAEGGNDDSEEMRERIEQRRQALAQMDISQNAESVIVVDGNGEEQVLYTDGRTADYFTDRGDLAAASSRWKGGLLVVRVKGEHAKATETWELGGGEDQQLYVTVKTEGGRMPGFEYRRVYDRVVEPAPEAEALN